MKITILLALCLLLPVSAAMTQTIGFQSYILEDGESIADGQYEVTFRIYNQENDGGAVWEERQDLTISGGVVNADLGAVESITELPFNTQYWVSLQLPDHDEMGRLKLSYSPYSITSNATRAPYYYAKVVGDIEVNSQETNENVVSMHIPPAPVSALQDSAFIGAGIWCNVVVSAEFQMQQNIQRWGEGFFTIVDNNDNEIRLEDGGVAGGANPYIAGFLIDPEANPGPYQVTFGMTNWGFENNFEINDVLLWVQWGVVFQHAE